MPSASRRRTSPPSTASRARSRTFSLCTPRARPSPPDGPARARDRPRRGPGGRGATVALAADEGPRRRRRLEELAKLRPAFKPDGTVTPATRARSTTAPRRCSSPRAGTRGARPPRPRPSRASRPPGCRRASWASAPCRRPPRRCDRAGLSLDDVDLIELNEAFAAQSLAVTARVGLDRGRRLNVNGGAIALGHPLGAPARAWSRPSCTSCRGAGRRYALATMCIGVGQGIGMLLERA